MVVVFLLSVLPPPLVAANPAGGNIDPAVVDQFMRKQIERLGLPGVAVAITRGDEVVHVSGYGHDSRDMPVTADTLMRVGSLSKSFTSLAVMQLVEGGKVNLDRPVRDYLPEFALADPRGERITVRQLLEHTSGMSDATFPEMSLPQPDSLEAAVTRLRIAKLADDPGSTYHYHNPNYHVAARLVEVVSGEPFNDYLRRHIFSPLSMDRTTAVDNWLDPVPHLAHGYNLVYGIAVARSDPDRFVSGSHGMVTSARDLAQWLMMQNTGGQAANGAQLVSVESIKQMHTPSSPKNTDGMGWDVSRPGQEPKQISHNGSTATFTSIQILLPDSGYGIAVMFNNRPPLEDETIVQGLIALTEGKTPETGGVTPWLIADMIFGTLTIVSLVYGVYALICARTWASQQKRRPMWRNVLALLPYLVPVGVFALLPNLIALMGRDMTWVLLIYPWIALVVWLAVSAGFSATILLTRAILLILLRREQH